MSTKKVSSVVDSTVADSTVADSTVADSKSTGIQFLSIPHNKLIPDINQPRQYWDQSDLYQLVGLIMANGYSQSSIIRVVPIAGTDTYQIIGGNRRWVATGYALEYSDLDSIPLPIKWDYESVPKHDILLPCTIESSDSKTNFMSAILDNLGRSDLHPLDEGKSYALALTVLQDEATDILKMSPGNRNKALIARKIKPQAFKTSEELAIALLAARLGLKQLARVTNRTALLQLTDEYVILAREGKIGRYAAEKAALLSVELNDPDVQDLYFDAIKVEKTDKNGNVSVEYKSLTETQASSLANAIRKKYEDSLASQGELPLEQPNRDPELVKQILDLRKKFSSLAETLAKANDAVDDLLKEFNIEEFADMLTSLQTVTTATTALKKRLTDESSQREGYVHGKGITQKPVK